MSTIVLVLSFLLLNSIYAQDIDRFFSVEPKPKQSAQQALFINTIASDSLLEKAYSSILQYKTELGIKNKADLI
ncbi:hypothetical protein [Abyssogena phaseoliformis symbiont]|uniref:hypothetical protein n=1 Tax=Abyssogena phaseoliformis symbiont TaxID=596095 RepID=UPI001915BD63|nr:hypothetical protein [Abyssogena phaseoliformis symbiont]